MRAIWLLLASEVTILAFVFLDKFSEATGRDIAGRAAIGTFELGAAAVSLFLLSQGKVGIASLFDLVGAASPCVLRQ